MPVDMRRRAVMIVEREYDTNWRYCPSCNLRGWHSKICLQCRLRVPVGCLVITEEIVI